MKGKRVENRTHPDHRPQLVALRRVQGQLAGIERMIESGRYCIDILTQFRAARASLQAIEAKLLERHLRGCVADAIRAKNASAGEAKIDELMGLLSQVKGR
jgi:DNA-binding FrmR family transcriptional regulator